MSRPRHSGLAKVAGRLAIVAATLPLIDAVRGVAGDQWWVVAAAVLALVAYVVPYLALPALVAGWLVGAPLAAAGAAVLAVMRLLGWIDARRTWDLDVTALDRAVGNVPPHVLEVARRHATTSVVGTDDLLRAAVAVDPARWSRVAADLAELQRCPEPALSARGVSLCVAEAALIIQGVRPPAVDIHLLAAIATQIPMSSAWAWSAERDLRTAIFLAGGPAAADETVLDAAISRTMTSPGGEALHRRLENAYRARRHGPPPSSLTEAQWSELLGPDVVARLAEARPVDRAVVRPGEPVTDPTRPSPPTFAVAAPTISPPEHPVAPVTTDRRCGGTGVTPTAPAPRPSPPGEHVPPTPAPAPGLSGPGSSARGPVSGAPPSEDDGEAPDVVDAHEVWDAPVGALLREAVIGWLVRALAGVGVAAVVLLVVLADPGVTSWLAAGLAGLTAMGAAASRPRWSLVVLAAAGATICGSLLGGWPAVVRIALAVAAAVVLTRATVAVMSRLSMASRPRQVRLRWAPGVFAARPHWAAAEQALLDERVAVAERILSRLETGTSSDEVRAVTVARMADIRLQEDRLEEASRLAERALQILPDEARNRHRVLATSGRVRLATGDVPGARALLERAVACRAVLRDTLVARAWAECSADPRTPARQRAAQSAIGGSSVEEAAELEIAAVASARSGPAAAVPAAIDRLDAALGVLDVCLDDTSDRDAARRLSRTAARARLLLGELHLRSGRPHDAAFALNRAVGVLTEPADRPAHATGRCLLGAAQAAMGWHGPARENLAGGLADLETHRGQLHQGDARARLLGRHGEVYTRALDALVSLADAGADIGVVASELLESLRRGALAAVLRERGASLPPDVRRIAHRVQELERRDVASADLALARNELEAATNAGFAAAYVPRSAEHHELHRVLGSSHTLSFRLHHSDERALVGHLVWTPPRGRPQLSAVLVEDPALLEVLGLHGEERREAALRERQTGDEPARWRRLAAALLPAPLRWELSRRTEDDPASLVIVPDGVLAYLPWAALRGDDDRVLALTAVTQLVPSLDLFSTGAAVSGRSRHRRPAIAQHLAETVEFAVEERHRLERLAELRPLSTIEELSALVAEGDVEGAYLAAHGDGEGFAQGVRLTDGVLSSSAALTVSWPPWVMFSSCLVGRVTTRPGREPLGLVVSCLVSGAHTVLGGVLEAHSGRLAAMGPDVAAGLLAGRHPARALRDAQCRELAARKRPAAVHRWAGLSCVSVIPPATP